VEALLKALKTPPIPEALPSVIYALSMIRDERITAPLIEAMNHPDPTIRANVAWALGQSENQKALAALKKALEDKDERVRKSAASAIDRVSSALANQQATTATNSTTAVAP
jgi:HEAT repeat protein